METDNLKHLNEDEAFAKLKGLAEGIKTCMFCTGVSDMPFETRPMATQEVDEKGYIWFFSKSYSNKNIEIQQDDQVQLLYADPSSARFLSINGYARILRDREKTAELWNVFAKTWFQEGKDDPTLTLICVRPIEAYYWDTKYGKMVTLLSMAASTLTGRPMDAGIEGQINLPQTD